jgi:hypothetical protein
MSLRRICFAIPLLRHLTVLVVDQALLRLLVPRDEDNGEHQCASNPQPVTRILLPFMRPSDVVSQSQIFRNRFFAGKE